jgi:hypothetical protein
LVSGRRGREPNLSINYHADMTLDAEDVARPAQAIAKAFKYWHSRFPGRPGIDVNGAKRVVGTLAPTMSIVRSVRQTVDEREEQV